MTLHLDFSDQLYMGGWVGFLPLAPSASSKNVTKNLATPQTGKDTAPDLVQSGLTSEGHEKDVT